MSKKSNVGQGKMSNVPALFFPEHPSSELKLKGFLWWAV